MSGGVLARIKSQLRYELAFAFKGSDPFLIRLVYRLTQVVQQPIFLLDSFLSANL